MEFQLLGPVEVWIGGQRTEAGPRQQRAVLATLLVDAGRLVRVESLVDRVWGENPPHGARQAVYAHVARIRQLLATAGVDAVPLIHRSGGYVLEVEPDRVDLHRFNRLVSRARDRAPDTEPLLLLREALELWRGEPLAGLSGSWAAGVRDRLRQQHLDAVLAWAEAELLDGLPTQTVGPLTELLDEHPLSEPLAALLMRALHTTGRGPEALDQYAMVRRRLVNEVGIEPGAELRRVHRMVLGSDQEQSPPAKAVPALLPPDVYGFTGRATELGQLDALLARTRQQPTAMVIATVSGTAGVGKTTLAVHWAHRAADRFPDGQLYLNLRGFDAGGAAVAPAEAVRTLLDALGVPARRIPAGLDAQIGLYRSRLAGRRMLVVLDNARDVAQVRPLLPGAPGCLVLVTSRDRLVSLAAAEAAHPLVLDLLSIDEARQLMAYRLGADRVAAAPAAVDKIIDRCARLPLALAVAGARAATQPTLSLEMLALRLRQAWVGMDTLDGGDGSTDVRAVFSWSYRVLTPDAGRLFRILSLHPGPDISAPAAASLAGLPTEQTEVLLAELNRAHLVTETAAGRIAMHDLLRAYATELADVHDPEPDRRAALRRLFDHYLHTGYAADRLLFPHRDPITLDPPGDAVLTEPLAEHAEALAWFGAEHAAVLAAIRYAAVAGFDTYAWQLAWTITDFLDQRGHWHDLITAQDVALAAASRLADPVGQAHVRQGLARVHARLGNHDQASAHLERALTLYTRAGDRVRQAYTHMGLSWVGQEQGRLETALSHARQAHELFETAVHRPGQARALNNIGWLYTELGNHRLALTTGQQALALHQDSGDQRGQAGSWHSLGYAHQHLGDHRNAIQCYQRALKMCRDLDDRYYQATTLSHLGDAQHSTGDAEAAALAWRDALAIFDELAHPDANALRDKLNELSTVG